ncbi:MAG TPA: lysylphosphatidylglycerol synthase transmembrane domain-containing protein [Candidatus Krumholzibacteria bacterium]|nr:lysylphosphatidylglycerol synthase transmembrane domain-containing protein [Candidatus Krumholzibacteria bacterium]
MNLPSNFTRRAFLVAGLAAAAWIAAALAFGWRGIVDALARFGPGGFALVAGLSLVNYGLRYLRWEAFLRAVRIRVPRRTSFAVYFATYVMVITPGKLGEVFKAAILRDRCGTPLAKGLPVVLAERVYDFLAVLALAAVGLAAWDGPWHGLHIALAAGAGFAGLLLLVRQPALRRRLVERAAASRHLQGRAVALDEALAATSTLLAPGPGLVHLVVSTLAWFCECAGLWLVCRTLAPQVALTDAVFIYAAATLAGSVSFLPGGLGGTEAVLILLLGALQVAGPTAAAAAFIVRVATLWLAVLVGLAVFAAFRDEVVGPSADDPTLPGAISSD